MTSLIDRFSSDPDLNTRATVAITALPFCHWSDEYVSRPIQKKIVEITTAVLKEHLRIDSPGLSNVVLIATVESTVHYLVGTWPDKGPRPPAFNILFILLSHIFFMSYGASPDTARAVAITLAAAAFANDTYPGGTSPEVGEYGREKRAVDVYNHYHAQESLTADMVLELFIFGFSGLLRWIDFNDESIRAAATLGNINQLIRHLPLFDFSRDSRIYTLPERYSLKTILGRSSQSLISLTNDTTTIDEVRLAYNCLLLQIHRFAQTDLYIPALTALCHVKSVEVQDLCLCFVDAEPIPKHPLGLLESAESRESLERLCRVLIDCHSPVASITALHFELLVAKIIICSVFSRSGVSDGQSTLRPLLNLRGESAGRIGVQRQLNVEALLSGLGECCKGNLTAEEHIRHTLQSIADFCELTEAVSTPSYGKEEEVKARLETLKTRLETLKNQLKPSSGRVIRQDRVEPGSIPSDAGLPGSELSNSGADISF
ncbi:hypothetical protein FRC12_000246 [Ceratobasidium sp. 428]|nr:hypothetical protein FRC12_000246 [Ceratobasidium sp. 428]